MPMIRPDVGASAAGAPSADVSASTSPLATLAPIAISVGAPISDRTPSGTRNRVGGSSNRRGEESTGDAIVIQVHQESTLSPHGPFQSRFAVSIGMSQSTLPPIEFP